MLIEHQCPQCGGQIILEDTDRLLKCTYCKTQLCIDAANYLRYAFPFEKNTTEVISYVPYWRFRGIRFQCRASGVRSNLLDRSIIALNNTHLPETLGIRPQALKLRFAENRNINAECFFKPTTIFDLSWMETKNLVDYSIVTTHETHLIPINGGNDFEEMPYDNIELRTDVLYHESFLAETVSIIYNPVIVRLNGIYDAITGTYIAPSFPDNKLPQAEISNNWTAHFVPAVCPNCAWDLIAEKDSCVLLCDKCNTAWHIHSGSLQALDYSVANLDNVTQNRILLPFWRIRLNVQGLELKSFKDLVRLTNLPKIIQPEWDSESIFFWIPAFKISPSLFLTLAKRFTLANPNVVPDRELTSVFFYPVNVPETAAIKTLKTVLVEISANKKMILPRLTDISLASDETRLVFYPFVDEGYQLTTSDPKCGIMKNALRWGARI